MRVARIATRTSKLALLVMLTALAVFLISRTYIGTQDAGTTKAVTEIVDRGPVVVDDIEWKLDSLKAYTRLVDEDKEQIDIDVPAGATIVVAELTVKALQGARISDGYTCEAELRDDRGYTWESESAFGFKLPTYCGDRDFPFERNVPNKVAKIYVVPKDAVPHLLGVVTPPSSIGSPTDGKRVLIRP